MPNEQLPTGTSDQLGSNGQGLPADSLESAIEILRGDARPTGEEPAGIRQQAALRERQALIEWAAKSGLRIDPASWAGKATIGGSEHDIWEDGGEMWKATRPDRFGWTILPGEDGIPEISEATPLEYLQRWANANRVLGDSVRLRGIAVTDEGVQVVISQPYLEGHYPSMLEVRAEMARHGFETVPFSIGSESDTTFYDDASRTVAFDASSDNFIVTDGVPIPVDVIIMRVGEVLRAQLLRLING